MSYIVDNAIIMAAGFASRFAPISYEKPKGLIKVKGEVLIERQIRHLQAAGIKEIIVVVGYKKEMFYYLKDKFNVILLENTEYETRNNHSSIKAARQYLKNSYICCSDDYFMENPYLTEEEDAFISVMYYEGKTAEWCATINDRGIVTDLTAGGENTWIMFDHVFFSENFSRKYLDVLDEIYDLQETKTKLWERIYVENSDKLEMKAKKYTIGSMYEFDSLSELREFDESFNISSDCKIMQDISQKLNCSEGKIVDILPFDNGDGMYFKVNDYKYSYVYDTKLLEKCDSKQT